MTVPRSPLHQRLISSGSVYARHTRCFGALNSRVIRICVVRRERHLRAFRYSSPSPSPSSFVRAPPPPPPSGRSACSTTVRSSCTQSWIGLSDRPFSRYIRCRPSSRTCTSPTSRSTRRCLDTCGCARPSRRRGRSPAARPSASRSRICRRRGSATALNASAVVAARAMGATLYADIGMCQVDPPRRFKDRRHGCRCFARGGGRGMDQTIRSASRRRSARMGWTSCSPEALRPRRTARRSIEDRRHRRAAAGR